MQSCHDFTFAVSCPRFIVQRYTALSKAPGHAMPCRARKAFHACHVPFLFRLMDKLRTFVARPSSQAVKRLSVEVQARAGQSMARAAKHWQRDLAVKGVAISPVLWGRGVPADSSNGLLGLGQNPYRVVRR